MGDTGRAGIRRYKEIRDREVQGRYIKINGKYREIRRNAGRYGKVMGWQI
jgi:hypothetical protein